MRQERIQLGQDVAALLTGSDYLFFVTYKGLKVKDVDSFKKQLAPLGAECHVLKNRFINKMAELNGLDALAAFKLSGDTAMISGKGDAGPVAKAIKAFSAETKGVLSAKGGYFDGAVLEPQQVIAIADLPGKDALRAQLLGLLAAVPTGLVRVLNAKASSIVNVINAYKNKLEENS
ncbi:MAG: 50S ribosomal protein L10 [Lentisphaeria bacterium]|jgi:large subunit ribosomal protein L10|nr:50S ribosomal protein L10 [Lentisphaeria bacterium]MDD6337268.1 50S ribosomal protein L10 [Lentisphaeria bacterium]